MQLVLTHSVGFKLPSHYVHILSQTLQTRFQPLHKVILLIRTILTLSGTAGWNVTLSSTHLVVVLTSKM